MIRIEVHGCTFYLEFRHDRERFRAEDVPHKNVHTIRAITTCVIVRMYMGDPTAIKFAAIGTAICWQPDNFSRRLGRLKALQNAIDHCVPLHEHKLALWIAYLDAHDSGPPLRVKTPKLSPEEKQARWAAGWEVRLARDAVRGQRARGNTQ